MLFNKIQSITYSKKQNKLMNLTWLQSMLSLVGIAQVWQMNIKYNFLTVFTVAFSYLRGKQSVIKISLPTSNQATGGVTQFITQLRAFYHIIKALENGEDTVQCWLFLLRPEYTLGHTETTCITHYMRLFHLLSKMQW